MNNRITPFVKRLRTTGGTIYTFNSAVEDIGLNINERNNIVKISHFALLNIPAIDEPDDIKENRFNVRSIPGAWEYEQNNASIKDGKVYIAESFENYALNLECNLLNQDTYNSTLTRTVSERVFWKWLKETGAIRWDIDTSANGTQYWSEEIDADGTVGYNSVVKYIGQVSAGNVRSDSFGTYNETYVLVPTSHGQTDVYFKIVEDDNYKHGMVIGDLGEKILGRETYTLPHPDALDFRAYYDFVDSSIGLGSYNTYYDNSTGSWTSGSWWSGEGIVPTVADNAYITDLSTYLVNKIYHTDIMYDNGAGGTILMRRSKLDCMSIVFDLNELRSIYNDSALTYDKMATEDSINDNFEFNAVLIYYTVYNSTLDQALATNLLGVLFIDAPTGNSSDIGTGGIIIPSLEKLQSTSSGFGTSYSLRLNIKTDNMVDDTQMTVVDYATSDQLYAEDWADTFNNLATAVNILNQNNQVIHTISTQYTNVVGNQTQMLNDIEDLKYKVNDITRDITGTTNVVPLFSDGDDPLVDSSIYMRYGNIGLKNNNPEYDVDITGTARADSIIVNTSIKDSSGNILIGYGSPLQIGSSTNYRDIVFYAGNGTPAMTINSSSNMVVNGEISVVSNFTTDGSVTYNGPVTFNGPIISNNFNFDVSYMQVPAYVGAGLSWDGRYLNVIPGADTSAYGESGWVQYNYNGTMYGDASLVWDNATGRLGIGTSNPDGKLHVNGDIYAALSNVVTSYAIYFNTTTKRLTYGLSASNDTSVAWLQNNTYNKTYVDSSLFRRIKDSSLNMSTFRWSSGYLEPSVAGTGGGGSGNVNWASGNVGSNNYVLTAFGDGSIVAESTMTYDGTGTLSILGTGIKYLRAGTSGVSGSMYIYAADSSTAAQGGNIKLDAGDSSGASFATGSFIFLKGATSTTGGDASIVGGVGADTGGNVYVTGGLGTASQGGHLHLSGGRSGAGAGGNVYVYAGNSSSVGAVYMGYDGNNDIGRTLFAGGTNSAPGIGFRSYNTTGFYCASANVISVATNGNERFRFDASFNFHADGDIISYSSSIPSDIRLKENIVPLVESLDKVLKLDAVEYDSKKTGKHQIGFIAQDVEKIIPEVISEHEILGNEGTYKMIRYTELIPYLVESIKQQNKMIQDLKEEISFIKQQIKS